MDIFLMIRRAKTTIFLDVKEICGVKEVKLMLQGITKVKNIRLYFNSMELDDGRTLKDYGINMNTAPVYKPIQLGMVYKNTTTEEWEPMEIAELSNPPELLDTNPTDLNQSVIENPINMAQNPGGETE